MNKKQTTKSSTVKTTRAKSAAAKVAGSDQLMNRKKAIIVSHILTLLQDSVLYERLMDDGWIVRRENDISIKFVVPMKYQEVLNFSYSPNESDITDDRPMDKIVGNDYAILYAKLEKIINTFFTSREFAEKLLLLINSMEKFKKYIKAGWHFGLTKTGNWFGIISYAPADKTLDDEPYNCSYYPDHDMNIERNDLDTLNEKLNQSADYVLKSVERYEDRIHKPSVAELIVKHLKEDDGTAEDMRDAGWSWYIPELRPDKVVFEDPTKNYCYTFTYHQEDKEFYYKGIKLSDDGIALRCVYKILEDYREFSSKFKRMINQNCLNTKGFNSIPTPMHEVVDSDSNYNGVIEAFKHKFGNNFVSKMLAKIGWDYSLFTKNKDDPNSYACVHIHDRFDKVKWTIKCISENMTDASNEENADILWSQLIYIIYRESFKQLTGLKAELKGTVDFVNSQQIQQQMNDAVLNGKGNVPNMMGGFAGFASPITMQAMAGWNNIIMNFDKMNAFYSNTLNLTYNEMFRIKCHYLYDETGLNEEDKDHN